jgi:opacity protein-like surface antigen
MTHLNFTIWASAAFLALSALLETSAHAQSSAETTAPQEKLNIQVEVGVMRDDNLTRANMRADRVSDNVAFAGVRKPFNYSLTEHSQLVFNGTLGGEKFRQIDGLSRSYIGGDVEYQYRGSSAFDEPTYGAFLKLTVEDFDSVQRDGNRISVGVSLRRTLTDRVNLYAALSHNRRHASSEVFSSSENALRGNLDFQLTDHALFYVGAEYRRGHIVSTGWPMMASARVSDVWTMDDVFAGMLTYRLRGNTTLVTLGFNYALTPSQSVDLSWRSIQVRPNSNTALTGIETSYNSNQLSLVYLLGF